MRFCPFCSSENPDEASHCGTCARRLPPLPPRRAGRGGRAAAPSSPPRSPVPSPPVAAPAAQLVDEPTERRQLPQAMLPSSEGIDFSDLPEGDGPTRVSALPPTMDEDPELDGLETTVRPPSSGPDDTTAVVDDEEWPSAAVPEDIVDPDDWAADARVAAQRAERDRLLSKRADSSKPSAPPPPASETAAPEFRTIPATAPTSVEIPQQSKAVVPARRATPTPTPSARQPPPTRPRAIDQSTPVQVTPIPEVPETGMWPSVRYTFSFARARWQRRGAIKELKLQIRKDTAALDVVLGTLGQQVRALGINNRALSAENEAINEAENRRKKAEHASADLAARQAEENARFGDIEGDRHGKLSEAEDALERAQRDHGGLDAQRKNLRDERKQLKRQQEGYIKAAQDREDEAAKREETEARVALRRAAEELRNDAGKLHPQLQDLNRRLEALEKPLAQASAKVETLKAEVEASRRSLNDAREGHRLRLAEIDAEQGRKSRDLAQAESEIQRRLVTLGTLVNLHRIDSPEFNALYAEVDTLRTAIGGRSNDIDRMLAEREAYDRSALIRGVVALGAAGLVLVSVIAILLAIL